MTLLFIILLIYYNLTYIKVSTLPFLPCLALLYFTLTILVPYTYSKVPKVGSSKVVL